jgi:hypothetical protein
MTGTRSLSLSLSCKQFPDSELSLASTWKEYLLEASAEKSKGNRGASDGRCAGTATVASRSMKASATQKLVSNVLLRNGRTYMLSH